MTIIDQSVTWRKVEERLQTETNPELRRPLELVLQHMKAEAAMDMEPLMATLSEKTRYRIFEQGGGGPQGKAAVRKAYEEFVASGAHRLQLDIDHLVVDKHCIVTEGVMRVAYPGKALFAMGIEVDDAEAYYLYETYMSVLWPIADDGLLLGEDAYVGGDGFAGIADRKVSLDDIKVYEPVPT
jgi:hypothetical protein